MVVHANETRNDKDLVVWKKAIALANAIYELTSKFPGEEKFGLVSQMRRAAVSIPHHATYHTSLP
ncbi:MAG TPA: four helix bundle protein [Chthoniobacterales bacterium]|nr:four helix bundle protein [Chthoniobacterales bacterium]